MASNKSDARKFHQNSFTSDLLGPGDMECSSRSYPWANAQAKNSLEGAHTRFENPIVKDHARAVIGNIFESRTTHITQSPEALPVLEQALYRSKSNEDQDYCYKGTRRAVLKYLLSKITAPGDGDMIWIVGPAGFGKSAIAKTLCRSLDTSTQEGSEGSSSDGFRLGASYFFRRIDGERSDTNKMIITIAQQLADNVSGFELRLDKYRSNVKQLMEKNSNDLFQCLVEKPLLRLSGSRIAIVVDALDECVASSKTVVRLLSGLKKLTCVCVRLLLTSRPTPKLDGFSEEFRPGLIVKLDDDDIVTDSQKDISVFLREKFREMHWSSSQSKRNEEWPSLEDFKSAVRLATSPKPLFIYAVTMCRFIGDEYADPRDRLQQWLKANRNDRLSNMFISPDTTQQLFSLYRTFFREIGKHAGRRILSKAELGRLRMLLHAVNIVRDDLPALSLFRLLGFSDFELDCELSLLRRNMQPILDIPQGSDLADSPLRIYHKSLLDFLKNAEPEDCVFYPFDQSLSGIALGENSLSLMSRLLCQLQRGDQPDPYDTEAAEFAFWRWPSFLCDYDGQIPDQSRIIDKFLRHHFVASFKFAGVYNENDLRHLMLTPLEHLCKTQRGLALQALFKSASSFTKTMMGTSCGYDPEDVRESALAFCTASRSFSAEQIWDGRVTRSQTYSLREPDTLQTPKPVSFHFSKGAAVFVALFSDKTIRRWNRRAGEIAFHWDLQSIFSSSRDFPDPGSRYAKLTTLSADGNLVVYSTATGVEVWDTKTGRHRRIQHPPGSYLSSMAVTEDGARLATCYRSTKWDALGQVWAWNITDVCNPRSRSSYLSKPLELLTIENAGDTLAGISFSPNGARLAVLSFSTSSNDKEESLRQRVISAQSWNTTTWESESYDAKRSLYDQDCLNVRMINDDAIAILWKISQGESFEYEVECWNLDAGGPTEVLAVPVSKGGMVEMEPEPFWIEEDTLNWHMSRVYFELDEDSELAYHLCFQDCNPDANANECIAENDNQRLLIPSPYRYNLCACGKDMFVFSSVENGDLKFVDLSHKDWNDQEDRKATEDGIDGSAEPGRR